MLNQTNPLARLHDALYAAGLGDAWQIEEAAAGIASPSRLATEWAGYRVTGPQVAYYAKVLQHDIAETIDLERSARASGCAGEAGVAPRLLRVDPRQGVLLFEALPLGQWRSARLSDLQESDQLQRLWQLKRAVHAGPSPDWLRSPMDDIERVRALCRRDRVVLPAEQPWFDQCVDMAWAALQCQPSAPVPVHGDGVASNVMVSSLGELKLVDFDRGGCMDPWHDVAVTLNELYPFEAQWREGIRLWAGECRELDYATCRLYALIDDWYWTLWALWAGTVSSRGLEFSKLGQWTLLRCRQSLQDPRLESWLRQVEGL